MLDTRIMELGERRRVTIVLWLEDGKTFPLSDPTWELKMLDETIAQGSCEAAPDGNSWRLTAEIAPETRGDHRLTYAFSMGTELIRRSVRIKVV